MRQIFFILLLLGIGFRYTDLARDSFLHSVLMPFVIFIGLVWLGIWLVCVLHNRGIKQTSNSRGDGGLGGFDGGGDGF